MKTNENKYFLIKDILLIIFSIIIALFLVKTDVLVNLLTSTKELGMLGSFVAGVFFTSVFTTAPAIVTLGEIAQSNSIISTAAFGALGAIIGDLIIFHFVKDRMLVHLMELVKHQSKGRRILALLRLRSFRWLAFFIGGLIIASPLPDELGISLLGLSKLKTSRFILLSFLFNFLGILLIGAVAEAL